MLNEHVADTSPAQFFIRRNLKGGDNPRMDSLTETPSFRIGLLINERCANDQLASELGTRCREVLETFALRCEQFEWEPHLTLPQRVAELDLLIVFARLTNGFTLDGLRNSVPVLVVPFEASAIDIKAFAETVPHVGLLALGEAGAKNAALLAAQLAALKCPKVALRLEAFREQQTNQVLSEGPLSFP